LGAQNADAEHSKEMIQTEDRVGKACGKTEWAVTRMGKEGKWK
jgi:hypothetical protein